MATLVKGSSSPVETGISTSQGDRESVSVVVEGLYSDLKSLESTADQFLPSAYVYDGHTLASTGDGMGKLTVRGIVFQIGGMSFGPQRTTFEVDMQECVYDLEDHPHVADVRKHCIKWVSGGCNYDDDQSLYFYLDESGSKVYINSQLTQEYQTVVQFCNAYMAGIKTFTRYYPVIIKNSYYSNPPGINMTGKSFTGGTATFSQAGTFDNPPISLQGYSANHWFKSKDSWEEQANKSWRRVEQWTYTPETSSGSHAWIYVVG